MYDNHAVCTMGNGHTIMKTIAIIDKSHVPGFHIGFFPWGGCRCVQGGGGGGCNGIDSSPENWQL